jgi:hypothetical protein
MTIDITEARALVETLKDYAEHPSSFTDISPTEADAAADLIDALMAERDALAREVDACAAALPGPYYMDPPDGGDVPISEQVKRMARDAARIQWLDEHALSMDAVADPDGFVWVWHGTDPARKIRGKTLREAIDRAMKGASDE